MARKRYLIIGDGAAGLTAAASLRHADAEAVIGVFSDEPVPGYYRAALTNYLLGELREDQLFAVPPDFYQRYGIHRIYTRVVGVDATRSAVWCSTSPEPAAYDQLLVASGARARAPSFEGAHLPGVLTLRTIADARQVYDAVRLRGLKTAVVLGGGALGPGVGACALGARGEGHVDRARAALPARRARRGSVRSSGGALAQSRASTCSSTTKCAPCTRVRAALRA